MLTLLLPLLLSGPADRVAVVVGNNLGRIDELELSYAESDAERVATALTDLGTMPAANVFTILNGDAEEVRERLTSLAGSGHEMVLFYFSGHGDAVSLHMSDSELELAELQTLLKQVAPELSIAVIDSCKSGAMTKSKGARRAPAYAVDVNQLPEVEGSIVISSSSADELSQESQALSGSYFTHHWVAGLYGRADANGDGLVMLDEAYRYAHFRTIETTIASRAGVQHPSYSFDLEGYGNIVLANLERSTAQIRLSTKGHGGRYFILDRHRELVLTELTRNREATASINLPPGRYRVRKRESHRILVADVDIGAGESITIRDENMRAVALDDVAAKGVTRVLHGPLVWAGMRNGLVEAMGPTGEVAAGYEIAWGHLVFTPRLVFRTATVEPRAPVDPRLQHYEFDFGTSAGLRWTFFERISLTAGADVGLVMFDQSVLERGNAPPRPLISGALPLGFQSSGYGEIGLSIGPTLVRVRGYAGAAVFAQEETQAEFVGGASLGVSLRF